MKLIVVLFHPFYAIHISYIHIFSLVFSQVSSIYITTLGQGLNPYETTL